MFPTLLFDELPNQKTHVFFGDSSFINSLPVPHYYKEQALSEKRLGIPFPIYTETLEILSIYSKGQTTEEIRTAGNALATYLSKEKIESIQLNIDSTKDTFVPFVEGLLLGSYYYSSLKKERNPSLTITLPKGTETILSEIIHLSKAVFEARDLVNMPSNVLFPSSYAERIQSYASTHNLHIEVLEEQQLQALKFGGLLAVNQGSIEAPYFAIIEYKPSTPTNDAPIVLVGKGVTYDTGGLSLKPTPQSMDIMKCDMGGSATVVGTLIALADNCSSKHVIGLIPITDNRIETKAVSPGDVITMHNGKTVEVMNTDAEGRLILADALSYASKYKPQLVIDIATLTGAALGAIGSEGIVYMGIASEKEKQQFEASGHDVYERVVEFPLWEEYDKQLNSDIADLKNIGGNTAGAITAGKFLQHFIDYNWLHLDIAGPAYLDTPSSYRPKGGTGVGVRLLYRFINELS